jgi:hypothetical protein
MRSLRSKEYAAMALCNALPSLRSSATRCRKVLEADPGFMVELAQLLAIVQQESGDAILNTGSGAVATRGGIAAGAGGVRIKGDVHGSITVGGPEIDVQMTRMKM